MLFKSTLLASVSGSVGGLTGSHGRSGMYFRARAIPTNPNSTAQQLIRGQMGTLSSLWNTLTTAQRASWDLYAANTSVMNKLGDPIKLTGQQMFLRTNVFCGYVQHSTVLSAPTEFNLGTFTPPTIVSTTAATGVISIGFNATDEWCSEDGAAMYIFGGRPQNAGIGFFKGPFRYASQFDGDNSVPVESPLPVTSPFTFAVGQKGWIRARVLRDDGRLSMDVIVGPDTAI